MTEKNFKDLRAIQTMLGPLFPERALQHNQAQTNAHNRPLTKAQCDLLRA